MPFYRKKPVPLFDYQPTDRDRQFARIHQVDYAEPWIADSGAFDRPPLQRWRWFCKLFGHRHCILVVPKARLYGTEFCSRCRANLEGLGLAGLD